MAVAGARGGGAAAVEEDGGGRGQGSQQPSGVARAAVAAAVGVLEAPLGQAGELANAFAGCERATRPRACRSRTARQTGSSCLASSSCRPCSRTGDRHGAPGLA